MPLKDDSNAARTTGLARQGAHVASVVDGTTTVLMDVVEHKYYSLDEVAGRIWQLVAEPTSEATIVAQLATEYEVPQTTLIADVAYFLRELEDTGLIIRT